jgi:ornithine cyclodeaminase/alanine dehydrogenase-like protein (mu-crystallin family)
MKHFTAADIKKKIPMLTAIALMREAFRQLSAGQAVVPVRTVIDTKDKSGRALFMPSYSSGFGLFGLKMVSVFAGNAARGIPAIQGQMIVMDDKTGTPLAAFDAEYLTALRTGAASGLATDLLSRNDSKILALFGTGAQAESQLDGVAAVRALQQVFVYGQSPEKIEDFCRDVATRSNLNVQPGKRADLQSADIICTATTSSLPVFEDTAIGKGVHINGIGSFKPSMQEIPEQTIVTASLFVDQRESALEEAGDIIIPLRKGLITADHIKAELGEIVSKNKPGRTSDEQNTVFKSVGNAIQDLAIAHAMLSHVS